MSVSLGTQTVTIQTVRRTKRVVIGCDYGEDPMITAFRERVDLIDGVVRNRSDADSVVVRLSQIASTSFTAGGATVTGAQLAALIAQAADQLEQG
jgi:hypothetical protein